jgi:NhaP-type Na+/H+ or K+/H+ antiporter
MLGAVTAMIIADIMIGTIIGAMPYTVGLANTVIRFMIRFVVGLMIGTIIGAIASTFTTA